MIASSIYLSSCNALKFVICGIRIIVGDDVVDDPRLSSVLDLSTCCGETTLNGIFRVSSAATQSLVQSGCRRRDKDNDRLERSLLDLLDTLEMI